MSAHVNNLNQLLNARRDLRNNATDEEEILWLRLRNSNIGFKFRRQHSIGNFIVDFYCPLKKLAIEIDGKQHLNNKDHDKERSEYLENLGIKIIRFWNNDINKNFDNVIGKIKEELVCL